MYTHISIDPEIITKAKELQKLINKQITALKAVPYDDQDVPLILQLENMNFKLDLLDQ